MAPEMVLRCITVYKFNLEEIKKMLTKILVHSILNKSVARAIDEMEV